jgi:hypothetical protein
MLLGVSLVTGIKLDGLEWAVQKAIDSFWAGGAAPFFPTHSCVVGLGAFYHLLMQNLQPCSFLWRMLSPFPGICPGLQ